MVGTEGALRVTLGGEERGGCGRLRKACEMAGSCTSKQMGRGHSKGAELMQEVWE